MKVKKITVTITDEQFEFINRLAEQDKVTAQTEMQLLFYCQLREEMELHEELVP